MNNTHKLTAIGILAFLASFVLGLVGAFIEQPLLDIPFIAISLTFSFAILYELIKDIWNATDDNLG